MIQPPDFREKQILFFDARNVDKCALSLRNENISIQENGKTRNKIPIRKLVAIFIFGDFSITSKLLQKIIRSGVSIFLLKNNFEVYASFNAYAEGNYLLRQKQYSLSPEMELKISQGIIANKLRNSLSLLRGAKINNIANKTRIAYKKQMNEKIMAAKSIDSLRGIEGIVSKDFFSAYFSQIDWYKRVPRGKVDENNILLDIGYTFLFNFVDSILRLYGFDTYKGIYHQLFFQRKSLACDMMEPFRCIIEKALLKMHKLKQFNKKDFGKRQGQYYLHYQHSGKYAKIFLEEILRYKMEIYNYIRDHYYLILKDKGEVKDFIIR